MITTNTPLKNTHLISSLTRSDLFVGLQCRLNWQSVDRSDAIATITQEVMRDQFKRLWVQMGVLKPKVNPAKRGTLVW